MTMPVLPSSFDRAFRDWVRSDTHAAYGLARERLWSPSDGFGPMLFAIGIYLNMDSRFAQRFMPGQHELQYRQTMRGPELQSAALRCRWNKTGSSFGAPDNVERPREVLLDMARTNMAPQLSIGLDDADPVSWVIAHAGNATNGLLSIHLAAPQMSKDGRNVVGWCAAYAIYDFRQPEVDFPDLDGPGLPEPVDLGDLDLSYVESQTGTNAQ